ncbi:MAG TPA: hypothetical protein VGI00_07650 [Streptosporangiaceae bacterium]|jgi:hypothetical protein
MKPLPLIMSFLPLIAFSLLAKLLPHGDIGVAALVAAIFALIAIVMHKPYWPPKILNAASLTLFLILAVVAFASHAGTDRWLAIWAGAGVGLVLGGVILLLLPVMPFTEQFARESTPQAYWNSPTFKRINRVLSAGWGAAIVALGVSRLIAAVIIEHSTGSHRLPDLLFGTAIPVVIIVYMLKFSADYPKRVTAHAPDSAKTPA